MTINELKKIFSDLREYIYKSETDNQVKYNIDKTYNTLNTRVYKDMDLNVDKTFKSLINRLKIDILLSKKEKVNLINTKTKGITLFQRIKINGQILARDIIKKIGIKKKLSIKNRLKKAFRKVKTIVGIETHKIIEKTKLFFGKKANKIVELEKEWVCRFINSRDLHKQLHGQVVDINDNFKIDGYTALYPGGFGIASMDCNCHCKIKIRRK